MITELGHFALLLAFGVAVIQTIVPLVGAAKGWDVLLLVVAVLLLFPVALSRFARRSRQNVVSRIWALIGALGFCGIAA